MRATICPHCGGEVQLTPAPRRSTKPAAFWPITIAQALPYLGAPGTDLVQIPGDISLEVLEWWTVSRRSRHGANCVWTEKAFARSCRRLASLPHWQQRLLIDKAVENGWQGLDVSYVEGEIRRLTREQQQRQRSHGPQSSQLREALTLINGGLHGAD